MRVPAPLLTLLVLLGGCAARSDPARRHANAFGRPGDAARASVLGGERTEPRARRSVDPLAGPPRSSVVREPLEPLVPSRGADYAPPASQAARLFGPWRLAGNGDVAMPLEGAWRMRVGLSAGGVPPEHQVPEPGRRAEVWMVPGVRVERDL